MGVCRGGASMNKYSLIRVPGLLLVGAAAVALTWTNDARADQIDDANRRLIDLDERVRVLSAEFRDAPPPEPNAADRRVLDAELAFNLKNYDAAATLCLDVIERYPTSRAADDAIVLLGESMFQNRDLVSAKRYFREAIKKNTGSRKEQSALQRLIEIALRTNDLEGVEEYLARLERIPPDRLEPSVPYVRAKYLYFRDKPDEALGIFYTIQPNNPYYVQARYFVGTVQVKKGDLGGAAATFESVLRIQPKNDADKEVHDLARMAIGRIHYERGQFDKAKQAYASVPRQSKHFADAMFESTWNAIKAKDFVSAYRSLDVMLLLEPDSPRAPELRILRGNLHLRLANFFLASDSFSETRDEFEPIFRQLHATRQRAASDASYFQSLVGKGMEKFDITLVIPSNAVKWVRSEPEVARMITLADDVGGLQRDVRASEQTIVRLERAVNGGGKVGIFPDLASSRMKSTEVLYQIVDIRRRFVGRIRALLANSLSGTERGELDRLAAERASLESNLHDLPLTAADLRKREERAKGSLHSLDSSASEFNVQIQAMDAQLVAIEQYYIRSRGDQRIRPDDLKRPVAEIRTDLEALRVQLESLRSDIAEAIREFGMAGAAAADERTATVRLVELMRREQEIYARARDRAGGNDRRELDAVFGVLLRADGVQAKVLEFDGRVDAAAERRVGSIKERISAEKAELQAVSGKIGGVLTESQSVGGGLAHAMLGKVTDRFYDLVVQSDVGLVDVSWGIKDQKTTNLSKLINQQKLELQSVEDDFRSLLEEEK
jgi:TolA-binding protein